MALLPSMLNGDDDTSLLLYNIFPEKTDRIRQILFGPGSYALAGLSFSCNDGLVGRQAAPMDILR